MSLCMAVAVAVCLNGSWDFRFEEDTPLERVSASSFVATDTMPVPGCYDVMPKWYLRHGTGLYRRTFRLAAPMRDAVLVVDGMGVRAKFEIDGKDLGVHAYPYARLEIPVGPLAAGDHSVFAAVDNIMEWPRVKLARPFYDFYLYGGFYHGVKLVEREPKVFVRTLDYRTGTVEVEIEGGAKTVRKIPNFRLWSPDEPNLTTIEVAGRQVRFGIRQIEVRNRKIFLNGKELFLKGFNRHESDWLNGAATGDAIMLQDIQRLKALGGNFIRGAHYQQCERFLDLCDESGVLVWEESLGWGNGHPWTSGVFKPNEMADPEFCDMQVKQTRDMVRTSFNHPCVIIHGFLNEPPSQRQDTKALVDRLIDAIRQENSGRLISFACIADCWKNDICHSNTDIVSFNLYPGTIPLRPGTPSEFAATVRKGFTEAIAGLRARYPDKPIMVSESGCGAVYGVHSENASSATEEFQEEYLTDIFETLWSNPDVVGYAIWQMNDGRTRERHCAKSVATFFGSSIAGVYDILRRPKKSVETVKRYFKLK